MSLDASLWAWKQQVGRSSFKLILLSLADRAGENHMCHPSIARLISDTELNRKTVIAGLKHLTEQGFIEPTGRKVGKTGQIPEYRLIGVVGREETGPKTVPLNRPKNGTVKQAQKRYRLEPETVPFLPSNSPKNGTRNLLVEPKEVNTPPIAPQKNGFAEFWDAYPSKVGRKTAEAKWKAKRLDVKADEIIADVKRRKGEHRPWLDGFIVNPTTYLHQERWNDEIQPPKPGGNRYATHQPVDNSLIARVRRANGLDERGNYVGPEGGEIEGRCTRIE